MMAHPHQQAAASAPHPNASRIKLLQAEIDHWDCLINRNRRAIEHATRTVRHHADTTHPHTDRCLLSPQNLSRQDGDAAKVYVHQEDASLGGRADVLGGCVSYVRRSRGQRRST
jgi:hypothetical protein